MSHITDQNRQLQQCQEDADLLHQFLQEKDAALKQLQDEIEELRQEKDKLQDDYDSTFPSESQAKHVLRPEPSRHVFIYFLLRCSEETK